MEKILEKYGEQVLLYASIFIVTFGLLQVIPRAYGVPFMIMGLAFISGVLFEKVQNGEEIL